jgi:hypothetical protein
LRSSMNIYMHFIFLPMLWLYDSCLASFAQNLNSQHLHLMESNCCLICHNVQSVRKYIVTWQLNDQNSGARSDGHCYGTVTKYASMATNTWCHSREMMETVFSIGSTLSL